MEIVKEVISIHVATGVDLEDKHIWSESLNGIFSGKSAHIF